MSGRPGARAALVLLALLASASVLPVAAADHAYSHRYIVFGQVVDAEGNPVPNVLVTMETRGFEIDYVNRDRCTEQPGIETQALGKTQTRPVTDGNGVFIYCFHQHAMSRVDPGVLLFSADGGNATAEVTMDPYLRVSHVTLELPDVRDDANRDDDRFLVVGRLWRPTSQPIMVESIRVYGETLDYTPVNLTLKLADGTEATAQTTTNGYGDIALFVPVTARPTEVVVQAAGETHTTTVDDTGMGTFTVQFAKKRDPFVANALLALGIVVGVAAVGGGGWYAWRKVAEKRELSNLRSNTTRKRANR